MWLVYMLLCDQKTFYIGITNDLQNRFIQHKTKQTFSTKEFSDFKLIYCEKYFTKHQAAIREKQLKGWSHAKKQMLIDGKLGINTCNEFAEELVEGLNM
jgi:putative endonuclease